MMFFVFCFFSFRILSLLS